MKRYLTPPILALVGVIVLAIALAFLLGNLLVGDASLIALGVALGILIGAPVGAIAYGLGFRRGRSSTMAESAPVITLTPEQAETLMRALERQQTSPAAFGVSTRQPRQITPVGGADLSALSGDSDTTQS